MVIRRRPDGNHLLRRIAAATDLTAAPASADDDERCAEPHGSRSSSSIFAQTSSASLAVEMKSLTGYRGDWMPNSGEWGGS